MSDKKRSNQDLIKEMKQVADKHTEMKAVVDNMLRELEVLEVKHQILSETIRDNSKK